MTRPPTFPLIVALASVSLLYALPTLHEAACAAERPLVVFVPCWLAPDDDHLPIKTVFDGFRKKWGAERLNVRTAFGKVSSIRQKLFLSLKTDAAPDIACVKVEWVPQLFAARLIRPLDKLLSKEQRLDIIPSLRRAVTIDNKIVALPYDADVRVIYYRKDLFAKAGLKAPPSDWTWQELLDDAKKLTLDTNADGKVDIWGFGFPASRSSKTVFRWLCWFYSCKGRFVWTRKGGRPELALSQPAKSIALKWYSQLVNESKVAPRSVCSYDQTSTFLGMAVGSFAMTLGGSWEYRWFASRSRLGDKVGIAPIPRYSQGLASTPFCGGWCYVILARSPERIRACWALLESLFSIKHQRDKLQRMFGLSPRLSTYDAKTLSDKDVAFLFGELVRAKSVPPYTEFAEKLMPQIKQEVQRAVIQPAAPAPHQQ